jgi:hypothetical protein
LASGLTRTIPRAAAASQSCSSIRKTTAAEVVSFLPQKERSGWAWSRSHVRQRLDGRALVGHGAIDVTLSPGFDMACGPTGCCGGMHLFIKGLHWTRSPRVSVARLWPIGQ